MYCTVGTVGPAGGSEKEEHRITKSETEVSPQINMDFECDSFHGIETQKQIKTKKQQRCKLVSSLIMQERCHARSISILVGFLLLDQRGFSTKICCMCVNTNACARYFYVANQ
jgi:hypothetical protein